MWKSAVARKNRTPKTAFSPVLLLLKNQFTSRFNDPWRRKWNIDGWRVAIVPRDVYNDSDDLVLVERI